MNVLNVILGVLVWVMFLVFIFSLCNASHLEDEAAERMYDEFKANHDKK